MASFEYSLQSLPSISFLVIDYNALRERHIAEMNKLFTAVTELGFFYLKIDLDPDPMFRLAEQVFELPLTDKLDYKMDGKNGNYYGYKSVGAMVTDKNGTPDMVEFWNISKDDILVQDGTNYPKVILDIKDEVKSYMTMAHEIVLTILEILSVKLGLDAKSLSDLHHITQPSGDQLRLTKSRMYPTGKDISLDVSLGAHTDFGSITILFNRLYGLQVLATNKEWRFVRPLPGHAIVNLGDALVKLSGGRLKSNIHRVVTTPGLSEVTDRYSVVYFSRPENSVRMRSLMDADNEDNDNDVLTAQEWITRRVKHFQTENYSDEETYAMSRGTEQHREV